MSHFTVMVLGDNPEYQLKPFDENIRVDEYMNKVVSDEEKARLVKFYTTFTAGERHNGPKSIKEGIENSKLSFDELYDKYGENWNSNDWRKNDDGVWCEFSTYNPKSKWDWYQLGGRWSDFLKLKENGEGVPGTPSLLMGEFRHTPGYCDQALKKDIDFDGMKDEAGEKARLHYEKVLSVFGGSIPKITITWESVIDDNNPDFNTLSYEEKRSLYHDQPAVAEARAHSDKLGHFFDIEDFQVSLEEYVKRARMNAIRTFAVLKNGVWYEKGEMGWWACVSNENPDWENVFENLINETGDDEIISIYDCHI